MSMASVSSLATLLIDPKVRQHRGEEAEKDEAWASERPVSASVLKSFRQKPERDFYSLLTGHLLTRTR